MAVLGISQRVHTAQGSAARSREVLLGTLIVDCLINAGLLYNFCIWILSTSNNRQEQDATSTLPTTTATPLCTGRQPKVSSGSWIIYWNAKPILSSWPRRAELFLPLALPNWVQTCGSTWVCLMVEFNIVHVEQVTTESRPSWNVQNKWNHSKRHFFFRSNCITTVSLSVYCTQETENTRTKHPKKHLDVSEKAREKNRQETNLFFFFLGV